MTGARADARLPLPTPPTPCPTKYTPYPTPSGSEPQVDPLFVVFWIHFFEVSLEHLLLSWYHSDYSKSSLSLVCPNCVLIFDAATWEAERGGFAEWGWRGFGGVGVRLRSSRVGGFRGQGVRGEG